MNVRFKIGLNEQNRNFKHFVSNRQINTPLLKFKDRHSARVTCKSETVTRRRYVGSYLSI